MFIHSDECHFHGISVTHVASRQGVCDCLLDHPTLHVDGPSADGRTGLTRPSTGGLWAVWLMSLLLPMPRSSLFFQGASMCFSPTEYRLRGPRNSSINPLWPLGTPHIVIACFIRVVVSHDRCTVEYGLQSGATVAGGGFYRYVRHSSASYWAEAVRSSLQGFIACGKRGSFNCTPGACAPLRSPLYIYIRSSIYVGLLSVDDNGVKHVFHCVS